MAHERNPDVPTPREEPVDVARLFRMPWKTSDNAMSWLEPTRKCNITCDACFAINDPLSQKSLERIRQDLDTLLKIRRCDAVLIAGGEPLTHPQIIDVVRMVKERGVKAQLVTNGVGLDAPLLHELHKNGAYGVTFHVDAHQARPGWKGKSEVELNELRQHFADMVRSEGGMVCGYNTTVFPDTLASVPDIIRWTTRNVRTVSVMTLIATRMLDPSLPFDPYVCGRRVELSQMGFYTTEHYDNLTTLDLLREVRQALPDFAFAAYVGGTAIPNSLKWGIACRIGSASRSYGNMGPVTMEIMQVVYHLVTGRYLSYARPALSRQGRSLLLFGVFDRYLRAAASNYLRAILRHPGRIFESVSIQTISLLQPIDILPNGEQDNCDGCPNGTVWNDRIVPACQLDNYTRFGGPVQMVPRA